MADDSDSTEKGASSSNIDSNTQVRLNSAKLLFMMN